MVYPPRRADSEARPRGEGFRPPMYAGKGENSWALDDDCIYSSTGPIRREPWTVGDAVAAYVASYEQSVKRYGRASA